jgi:hypothetical protein
VPSREQEVAALPHPALQIKADAQHHDEVGRKNGVVDRRDVHGRAVYCREWLVPR